MVHLNGRRMSWWLGSVLRKTVGWERSRSPHCLMSLIRVLHGMTKHRICWPLGFALMKPWATRASGLRLHEMVITTLGVPSCPARDTNIRFLKRPNGSSTLGKTMIDVIVLQSHSPLLFATLDPVASVLLLWVLLIPLLAQRGSMIHLFWTCAVDRFYKTISNI